MQAQSRSFTCKYDVLANVLKSPALIQPAFHPATTPKPPEPKEYGAIWDTGASSTVITDKVINECKLKPIGITNVNTAKGEMRSRVYLVNVGLPMKVGIYNLRVIRGVVTSDADVLIGMDIIAMGDFAITNIDGKTTYSFRMPSCERIDFIKQKPFPIKTKIIRPSKIGRNAPCPCGSGKKYKNCCGK